MGKLRLQQDLLLVSLRTFAPFREIIVSSEKSSRRIDHDHVIFSSFRERLRSSSSKPDRQIYVERVSRDRAFSFIFLVSQDQSIEYVVPVKDSQTGQYTSFTIEDPQVKVPLKDLYYVLLVIISVLYGVESSTGINDAQVGP